MHAKKIYFVALALVKELWRPNLNVDYFVYKGYIFIVIFFFAKTFPSEAQFLSSYFVYLSLDYLDCSPLV